MNGGSGGLLGRMAVVLGYVVVVGVLGRFFSRLPAQDGVFKAYFPFYVVGALLVGAAVIYLMLVRPIRNGIDRMGPGDPSPIPWIVALVVICPSILWFITRGYDLATGRLPFVTHNVGEVFMALVPLVVAAGLLYVGVFRKDDDGPSRAAPLRPGSFTIGVSGQSEQLQRALLTMGESAVATVQRVEDRGIELTGHRMLRLQLEVQPQGGTRFLAQVELLVEVGSLGRYRTGAVLPVKFNPHDLTQVAVVPEAG